MALIRATPARLAPGDLEVRRDPGPAVLPTDSAATALATATGVLTRSAPDWRSGWNLHTSTDFEANQPPGLRALCEIAQEACPASAGTTSPRPPTPLRKIRV